MADDTDGRLTYLETILGRDEPDVAWCNGAMLIEMRRNLGDSNLLDSDRQPIVPSWVYILTPGEVHQYWEDVIDE